MEITDSQLIKYLTHAEVRVRSASLESLAASFCSDPLMLRAIFDAWDQFEPATAFPELPILTHLPVHESLADESLLRASAMVRGRKIVDPVCRSAGKLIEAYSVACPENYARFLPRFESLKRESKIFFRVDIEGMQLRASMAERTDDALRTILGEISSERGEQSSMTPSSGANVRCALDELHARGQADNFWSVVITELEEKNNDFTPGAEVGLEVLSRRSVGGYEDRLVRLLDHGDAKVADAVAISLARSRSQNVLDAISREYLGLETAGKLRAAVVLQRLRLPGVASRIRLLKESARDDRPVSEALLIAEILQFDFEAVEDWLEALLVIDDRSLHRIEQRLHIALPLATQLPVEDQPRFMKLFRSRLVD